MTTLGNWHSEGANRGYSGVRQELPIPFLSRFRKISINDVKPNRAELSAQALREQAPGVTVLAQEERDLSRLTGLEAGTTITLCLDSPQAIAEMLAVLPQRPGPLTWHLLARESTDWAAPFALIGSIEAPDHSAYAAARALLDRLAVLGGPPVDPATGSGSAAFRGAGLGQLITPHFRGRTSHLHARRLMDTGQDPEDKAHAPLAVYRGEQAFPLVVVRAPQVLRRREQKELALHSVDRLAPQHLRIDPTEGGQAVVALLPAQSTQLVLQEVTVRPRGRRLLTGTSVLEQPQQRRALRFTD